MENSLHYEVLDEKRRDFLPLLVNFKENFYLAGGTGLALLLGHRASLDFDFFTKKSFDPKKMFEKCLSIFQNFNIKKIQEEKDTLTIIVGQDIKISFFAYPYDLVDDLVESEYFKIASMTDIGCMKLSAITGRSTMKDYVDIYFILQKISLKELLLKLEAKFPYIDRMLVLKSLSYFEDLEPEAINYKNRMDVDFERIKDFLVSEAQKIL